MAATVTDGAQDIDRIANTFKGKRVLITGGTGFLGKVLIEKLLRKCVDIDKLILVVRPKKGKEPLQRVEEMFGSVLFENLLSKVTMAQIMSKITAVTGDAESLEFGLSQSDRRICQTANIIIHSAATVRFDEGLKKAVLLNTRGTRCMLDLAKTCPSLQLFIHVSTAYCHLDQKILEEQMYPPPADPHKVISLMETFDEDTLNSLNLINVLGDYPNTYAYSKALSEALIEEAMPTLPIIVMRPSVVVPIYKEPVPGWTDNINGPTGLLIGAGKGVIRTMYGDDSGYADFVPVDCVVNVIMLAAWDFLENGCHPKVMNLTSSDEIQITWKEVMDLGLNLIETKVPLNGVVWYPAGGMTKYYWLHYIRAILYHWIPAILVDCLLYVLGYKPILMRVQRRVSKGMDVFEYYTNQQWNFKSGNLQNARQKMTEGEREAYKMDIEGLILTDYFEAAMMSARRHILKEKDEDIPGAMRHLKRMKILAVLTNVLFYVAIVYFLYSKFFSTPNTV